ncbi:hypothetical protein [Amycolatopsis sp. NBC_01480]|uniref:hypothetical protein n=1 Tax=Amycolatopsis sp. NBC_01480 TaxID=2903562 RepID=UPI002E28D3B1|nr:hypothetical protein [Amycolatopsis sp. NBC_01480]
MAHYLLACTDTHSLDDLDDATLDDLSANPDTLPRYVWCESCTTWQPVAELVICAATGNPHAADEPEPVPRPRASETDHADAAVAEDSAVPTPARPEGPRHARRSFPPGHLADRSTSR